MGKISWFPPALLVVVSVVWGSTFFVVKGAVNEVNEYMLVFMRSILAALPLFAILVVRKPKAITNWATIRVGAILGLLMGIMYTSQTIGLKYTSSGHSAFITGIAVVLVPVVMFVFFKYKFRLQNIVAVTVVALGLFFLTYDTETAINKGDIITFATALSAALHISLLGVYVRKHNVMALVAYQFLFSALFNLAIYLSQEPLHFNFSEQGWSSLLYLGFVGTLFCYGASSWAQKYVSPVTAALIFSLEPLFASVFSYFFDNEVLHTKELIGATLILGGIIYYELPVKSLYRGLRQRINVRT